MSRYNLPLEKYAPRRLTNGIVIHAALTLPEQSFTMSDVRDWHRQNGWIDAGYHFGINRDGSLEYGRPVWAMGAHVSGHNSDTIGIVLMGGAERAPNGDLVWAPDSEENFTPHQRRTLFHLVWAMKLSYPDATVKGHRDYLPDGHPKLCPAFDVGAWYDRLFRTEPAQVYGPGLS